jgi:RNA recognition motif-containing protein
VEVGAELFIGNLDPMVDEKTLYDTFSRFGSLVAAPKVCHHFIGMRLDVMLKTLRLLETMLACRKDMDSSPFLISKRLMMPLPT